MKTHGSSPHRVAAVCGGCHDKRYTFFDKRSAIASAELNPSPPKPMKQSLHVLRCALHGSLLPMHLEQRLCRPVGASEQESVAM